MSSTSIRGSISTGTAPTGDMAVLQASLSRCWLASPSCCCWDQLSVSLTHSALVYRAHHMWCCCRRQQDSSLDVLIVFTGTGLRHSTQLSVMLWNEGAGRAWLWILTLPGTSSVILQHFTVSASEHLSACPPVSDRHQITRRHIVSLPSAPDVTSQPGIGVTAPSVHEAFTQCRRSVNITLHRFFNASCTTRTCTVIALRATMFFCVNES